MQAIAAFVGRPAAEGTAMQRRSHIATQNRGVPARSAATRFGTRFVSLASGWSISVCPLAGGLNYDLAQYRVPGGVSSPGRFDLRPRGVRAAIEAVIAGPRHLGRPDGDGYGTLRDRPARCTAPA